MAFLLSFFLGFFGADWFYLSATRLTVDAFLGFKKHKKKYHSTVFLLVGGAKLVLTIASITLCAFGPFKISCNSDSQRWGKVKMPR